MRPSEIDYASRRKHYFDIANGEVLVGASELRDYRNTCEDPSTVVDLGHLIRNEEPVGPYPRLDVSEWDKETFARYGKWLNKILPPVDDPEQPYHMTEPVLERARQLGIGPGAGAIRRKLGSLSIFYAEAGITDVHAAGLFKDWEIDDFVSHIKKVGQDEKPTYEDINKWAKRNPRYPKPGYIQERYEEIGGYNRLLELAGYTVVRLWDREDYINWGVSFMHVNEGTMPTSRMIDYLASKKIAPSSRVVDKKFKGIRAFQTEVMEAYSEERNADQAAKTHKLATLQKEINRGATPAELFNPEGNDETQQIAAETDVEAIAEKLGVREVLLRYAQYKVAVSLLPYGEQETKIAIGRGAVPERKFIAAIRKYRDISPCDIEHEAILLDVFDDIWPPRENSDRLKLDEGFEVFMAEKRAKDAVRHKKHRDREDSQDLMRTT